MKPHPRHSKPPARSAPALHKPRAAPRAPAASATHWDNVTDWYDRLVGDEGSDYHQHVVLPGVLRMLETKTQNSKLKTQNVGGETAGVTGAARDAAEGLRILDLACGQGVLCRQLAQRGYSVVGVDAAVGLIEAARKRNAADKLAIEYAVADVTKLADAPPPALVSAAFDAVTIILAIQNITPLSPVWQACRGLLKPGGSLIVVMMHPCFRVPRGSGWHWDEAVRTQSRMIKQYLTSSKVEIEMHPGAAATGKASAKTLTFHRPLQAYINTLGNAGLPVDHIEEWASHKHSQPGPKQAELDRSRQEIPMFLALRAKKMTS